MTTQAQVAEIVARWQRDLRLADWRIDVEVVRELRNRDGAPVHGLCWPQMHAKRARIQINDPATPWLAAPPVEDVVVHELLHLHFAPLSGATQAEVVAEEQAVWAIQEAIAKVSSREAQVVARAMAAHAAERTAPRRQEAREMEPKLIQAALDAIVNGDGEKAIEILKGLITSAAGGAAPPSDGPPPAEAAPPPAAPVEEEKAPMSAAPPPPVEKEEPKAMPAPKPMAATAAPAKKVVTTIEVMAELDGMKRDALLREKGSRLSEPQRAWAATQPFDTVKGLIEATPEPEQPSARPAATRGAGQGAAPRSMSAEAAELDARMGLAKPGPAITREGRSLTFRAMTADQAREHLAARADASKGGAR